MLLLLRFSAIAPVVLLPGCFLWNEDRENMKSIHGLLFGLLLSFLISVNVNAGDVAAETKRLAKEVEALQLGFGDYVLCRTLTNKQKEVARKHPVAKALAGTYKFQDGEVFVVANKKTDMVLGIYKEQSRASRGEVQTMIGDLMLRFAEPTAMAHDKMIYWAYDKNGKISEELFERSKQTGKTDIIATVKFSSSLPIAPTHTAGKGEQKEAENDQEKAGIYVIITSNPLSNIFLTYQK